jgi:hypothetical protein
MALARTDDPLGRLVAPVDQTTSAVGDADIEAVPVDVTPVLGNSEAFQENDMSDPLDVLDSAVQRAQAYAERWGEPYRLEIFRMALARLLSASQPFEATSEIATPVQSDGSPRPPSRASRSSQDLRSGNGPTPVEKLARALNGDAGAVERALQISPDGKVSILGRLTGRSKKELQTRYTLVYLYVKEIALSTRLVDIEELRELCDEQGCYDLSNFTGNFRKDVESGLLREQQGEKGSRARRYMLSQSGVAEGAALLRQLVEQ